jgi:hypothetical protein
MLPYATIHVLESSADVLGLDAQLLENSGSVYPEGARSEQTYTSLRDRSSTIVSGVSQLSASVVSS